MHGLIDESAPKEAESRPQVARDPAKSGDDDCY